MDYYDLNRRFVERESYDQDELIAGQLRGKLVGWSKVLENRSSVIVAAANFGKTTEMLSMGRMRLHTCRATTSLTIAQIANVHLASVIADAPDCVYVLAGANDVYGPATPDSAAAIFERLRDLLWVPLMNAGIFVFGSTVTHP